MGFKPVYSKPHERCTTLFLDVCSGALDLNWDLSQRQWPFTSQQSSSSLLERRALHGCYLNAARFMAVT